MKSKLLPAAAGLALALGIGVATAGPAPAPEILGTVQYQAMGGQQMERVTGQGPNLDAIRAIIGRVTPLLPPAVRDLIGRLLPPAG
jgi:hypothetical protein